MFIAEIAKEWNITIPEFLKMPLKWQETMKLHYKMRQEHLDANTPEETPASSKGRNRHN